MTEGTRMPRRCRVDLMKPAEMAIHEAIKQVEALGADVKLTEAVTLLGKAADCAADFIDAQEPDKSTWIYGA